MTRLRKQNGAPNVTLDGEVYSFDPDTRELEVEDDVLARRLAASYNEVEIVQDAPPTISEAEDDYRAAQALAKHLSLPAGGSHDELLDRIRDAADAEDGEA